MHKSRAASEPHKQAPKFDSTLSLLIDLHTDQIDQALDQGDLRLAHKHRVARRALERLIPTLEVVNE